MRHRTSPVVSTILFVIPTALIIAAVWWFFAELQPANKADTTTVSIVIAPKTGLRGIGNQLDAAHLVHNKYVFEAAVLLAGLSKDLKAGTYDLSPSMSSTAIARALTRNPHTNDVTLTILEAQSNAEIGQYLESKHIGTAQDFITASAVTDSRTILPDDRFDFLSEKPANVSLQGFLFPDTYRVFPNATAVDVIKKMLTNFGTKVTPDLRQQITSQGKTLYQVLTLASIVEKEAKTDADRKMVADVFWRRLAAGMPLQSDVTVEYVTGHASIQAGDTDTVSPYNTYVNKGLPPTPIDNPGLSSIMAVIQPTSNTYWYFLADTSGTVHYSKTYDEHLLNVQRYL